MINKLFNFDERNKTIFLKVSTSMYFFTLLYLTISFYYKQYFLGIEISQQEDTAVLLTLNAILFLSFYFFFSGTRLRINKAKRFILLYFVFVSVGTSFTFIKYFVFNGISFSWQFAIEKFLIVAVVSTVLTLLYMFFAHLGYKRIEKDIS